jgi:hypothetical protein
MNKFENPQGTEAQNNNVIDCEAAKTRLKENQPKKEHPESRREGLRAELMNGCDAIEERFSGIEKEGLSNVSPAFADRIRGKNEEVYQAVKAYREEALDIISTPMPAEELLEIRKMISGFFEEMNQRAHQEDVKSKEGQSKSFVPI